MRHAGGRSKVFAWWVALCTVGACSGALRPPSGAPPAQRAPAAEPCVLAEEPSRAGDTAAIVFRTAGAGALRAERDACALRLVAAALRPWPTASSDRWTVRIALTDPGATAHRLGGDSARDAIDAGLAVIATEDLDLAAYAATRPELEVTPLPWDRTYLRLASGAVLPLGAAVSSDAVRVDARPAEPLFCDPVVPSTASGGTSGPSARIVYEAGDRTARELAERVVALVPGTTVAAIGLAPAELDAALRSGTELAYIVSVPRSADSGCDALEALARRAPWLASDAIVPLIDTRAHAIAPRPLPRGHPRP